MLQGVSTGGTGESAVAWHAILRAALPDALPRLVDSVQGTTIGVLMSATLPARLGEPSRALIVARRLGRVRERLPQWDGAAMDNVIDYTTYVFAPAIIVARALELPPAIGATEPLPPGNRHPRENRMMFLRSSRMFASA